MLADVSSHLSLYLALACQGKFHHCTRNMEVEIKIYYKQAKTKYSGATLRESDLHYVWYGSLQGKQLSCYQFPLC